MKLHRSVEASINKLTTIKTKSLLLFILFSETWKFSINKNYTIYVTSWSFESIETSQQTKQNEKRDPQQPINEDANNA